MLDILGSKVACGARKWIIWSSEPPDPLVSISLTQKNNSQNNRSLRESIHPSLHQISPFGSSSLLLFLTHSVLQSCLSSPSSLQLSLNHSLHLLFSSREWLFLLLFSSSRVSILHLCNFILSSPGELSLRPYTRTVHSLHHEENFGAAVSKRTFFKH